MRQWSKIDHQPHAFHRIRLKEGMLLNETQPTGRLVRGGIASQFLPFLSYGHRQFSCLEYGHARRPGLYAVADRMDRKGPLAGKLVL